MIVLKSCDTYRPRTHTPQSTWEVTMRGRDNAVKRFEKTWISAHGAAKVEDSISKGGVVKKKPHPPSDDEGSDGAAEDTLKDFDLSSVDSD